MVPVGIRGSLSRSPGAAQVLFPLAVLALLCGCGITVERDGSPDAPAIYQVGPIASTLIAEQIRQILTRIGIARHYVVLD